MRTIMVPAHSLQVRPVAQAELDAVLGVYRRCEDFLALGPVPAASLTMVLHDLAQAADDGSIFCGICTLEGAMVGVVEYAPKPSKGDSKCACLSLLMLAREHRSRGIGSAVLAAVETELRENSQVAAIVAPVQVNNPRALAFWQRHGYRVVSGPELQPDHTTVLTLRKDLP